MSCSYKIGKLKNFIYLIKDLKYRVSNYKVYITNGEIYKLNANLVTLNETESYAGRFKFTTTVTATLNRIFNDSVIRQGSYKVVVEDTKGQQYIVSPEFNANYTGEFTINQEGISYALTFTTQSNIPTRILQSRIVSQNNNEMAKPICQYSGTGIQKLFVGNNQWKEVDFLSAEYVKTFNGSYDQIQVTFSYPIEDNDQHYQLISFPQNRWNVKIQTANEEVIEYSLFPQYTRQTAEEGGTDRFTIVMRGIAQSNLKGTTTQQPQYRWVPISGEYICDGFHKYVKEQQEILVNNQWSVTGKYRKGALIETNSEDCGYTIQTLYRWFTMDINQYYECIGFDKHYKQKQYKSDDNGITWVDTGITRAGDIVQVDSADCGYVLTEWKEVEGEYICEEYDPSVTWVLLSDEYYCQLKEL